MDDEQTEHQQEDEQELAIYSKTAILCFSIFFSPIAGAALLMLNLRSIGYKKEGGIVLFCSIAYQILAGKLSTYFFKFPHIDPAHPDLHALIRPFIYTLITGIIGGGILAEYAFRKYFPGDNYERKSIGRPLIIVILAAILINLLFGF